MNYDEQIAVDGDGASFRLSARPTTMTGDAFGQESGGAVGRPPNSSP